MLDDPETRLVRPEHHCGTGVLVLAGSSGRVDLDRAELLSRYGAVALAIRWFGGPGQQPGPFEVPIELFASALDRLSAECDRLVILGTSFGAEAALLVATRDERISAVVALAPSSVIWPGWNGEAWTSHWTIDNEPVPYVPFLPDWEPNDAPPSYVELYRGSLDLDEEASNRAAIRVEDIRGDVVLVAGGDDRVWPSVEFASRISLRRGRHGLATVVVSHDRSGHRAVLPGEPAAEGGMAMNRGGSLEADRELGTRAWPAIAAALKLNRPSTASAATE